MATAPAQIQFTPDGSILVVTEKSTNNIDTYLVGRDGRTTGPIVTPADAETPFGFDIANRNQLFVSDDFNDAPGAGAMSVVDDRGRWLSSAGELKSSCLPESGACWVAVTQDGRFAFMADTVASTTSTYIINKQEGSVSLLQVHSPAFLTRPIWRSAMTGGSCSLSLRIKPSNRVPGF